MRPLILRQEHFGGILFAPHDGSFLELDHDGYAAVRDRLRGRMILSPMKWQFLKEVEQIIVLKNMSYREVPLSSSTVKSKVHAYSAPTLVDLQITNQCFMDCPHCYASSHPKGEHMPLENIKKLFTEMRDIGVMQVAVGGGEPLLHPHFTEILEDAYRKGLVVNITTLGLNFKRKSIEAIKAYSGAVALSLEATDEEFSKRRRTGFIRFRKSLSTLLGNQIPTVLQVVVSAENLHCIGNIVDFAESYPELYGVIFLAYKPVGRGEDFDTPLKNADQAELYSTLKDAFCRLSKFTRVGYDCCFSPGIGLLEKDFGFSATEPIEGCSAMRGSLGVMADLLVAPCTFTTHLAQGSLKNQSLLEVWTSANANLFRQGFASRVAKNNACSSCPRSSTCLGGCPAYDLVNCDNNYLSL